MKTRFFQHRSIVALLILCVVCILVKSSSYVAAADKPAEQITKKKKDRILATVNGEPVYESRIEAGIPLDVYDFSGKEVKKIKLKCEIESMSVRQFLKKEHIIVPEKDIDAQVEKMRKTPPPSTCMCCSYASLEDYLKANFYTMADLRREIANGMGIMTYLDHEWQKNYTGETDKNKMINSARTRLEKGYVKTWHIFFNTFQQPDYFMNPDVVNKKTLKRAESVWERLRKGENFEKLASEVSDDVRSKKQGGYLGCVPLEYFGRVLANVKEQCRYGEFSKPLGSMYGFHIVKYAPMNDRDIWDLLKAEFMDKEREKLLKDIRFKAVVVKFETD